MRPRRIAVLTVLLCLAGGALTPGGRLAAESQGQGSQDPLIFSRAYLWAASTFSSWCRNKRLKCCECECEDDGSSGDFICLTLPLGMPCPEGWESDGASTVDNVGWNHHHTACDYQVRAPGGACASCGTGGAAGDHYALPSFALKRTHRSREAWLHSNFGPGVFSNFDSHLQLDIKNGDGSGKIALFDVTQFGRVVYSETGQSSPASDGVYQQASHAASKELTLYDGPDGTGSVTHDIRQARSAVLRTHGGNRVIFDLIRTSPDANTTRYYGRFRIFRNRNDVDLVVDYQFAPTATDAELGNDRFQLWKIASVTDGYGRVATFTYGATQVGGMWAIASVDLPNGATVTYGYDGTELVAVDHPDGTQSTFTRGAAADNLVPLTYDDNAAGGTHRRKTVYLSTATWVDPDDPMHVETQSEGLARLITNAEGEVAYLNWEDDTNNERIYLYEGGGTLKIRQSVAGYPVKDEVAKAWVLEDDPATWDLELTYTFNHNFERFITKATDNLGRQRAYGYDVAGAALTSTTHFDGTTESWERNQCSASRPSTSTASAGCGPASTTRRATSSAAPSARRWMPTAIPSRCPARPRPSSGATTPRARSPPPPTPTAT